VNGQPAGTALPGTPNLAFGGVVVTLVAIGVRVLSPFDPMPAWSGDPLTIPAPIVGITPRTSLILDAAMLLGTALIVLGMHSVSIRPRFWEIVLFGLGAAGVGWHVASAESNTLDHTLIGSSWVSALAAGVGASVASRDARLRAFLAAGLVGIFAATVFKGVLQVTVEHSETVRAFRRDRSAFLGSHGWSEDSPMARAYERRLDQPEATGYFGLANVYASIAASVCVALLGLVLALGKDLRELSSRRETRWWLFLLAPGIASLGILWLAGAKGGFAAAALGAMLLALAWLVGRTRVSARTRSTLGTIAGVAIILSVLGAIVARGLLGERLGELSVFFRWFYVSTAARIFGQHPLLGVGPAGFKDAYMLAKPPISPEDVASPHSILFDFAATLGVFGVAWGALFLAWCARAGRSLLADAAPPSPVPSDDGSRRPSQWLVLSLVAPVGIAGLLERSLASPENALTRLGSVAFAVFAALSVRFALSRAPGRLAHAAFPAGALALAAHAQIELTGATSGSVAWAMCMLALAGRFGSVTDTARETHRAAMPLSIAVLAAAAIIPGAAFPRVARWETSLRTAAEIVAPVGDIGLRLRSLPPSAARERAILRNDIDDALKQDGLVPPADPRVDESARFGALRRSRMERAMPALTRALGAQPDHTQTLQAVTRLQLMLAEDRRWNPATQSEANAMAAEATDRARNFALAHPSAASWGWAGTLLEARHAILPDAQALAQAITSWETAATLAPHASIYPVQIARASARSGDAAKARVWAEQALRNDTKARLDPLQGLSDEVRREMAALAAGQPTPAQTGTSGPPGGS